MDLEQIETFHSDGVFLAIRSRKEVHQLGLWHRGVHVFLFDKQGRLLVQKRGPGCDTFANAYDCSMSEHLSVGESFKHAAVRGCREELGVTDIPFEKLIAYKMAYGPTDNMICELYSGSVETNLIHFNKDEVASIDFIFIEDLLKMLNANPLQFTSWFKEQLLWFSKLPNKL